MKKQKWDEERRSFISGKKKSDTELQKKNPLTLLPNVTTFIWVSLKNRKMWSGIFKSIKETSVFWQIVPPHLDLKVGALSSRI